MTRKRDPYKDGKPTGKLARVTVDESTDEEETTRVRCPVCKQGTVAPEVAAMVNGLLLVREEKQ